MTTRMPKLIAFDLDYTLWDLWIDTHVTGPLHRNKNTLNEVRDRHNDVICFYKQVPDILHRIRDAGVTVAAVSRTCAPNLARQALSLLLVPPLRGDADGSKLKHFKKIHERTGIPYDEMLFFDDEHRNSEVESLGVTFCLVRNGMDLQTFEKGLAEWRRRHPVKVVEDPAGDADE
ncbi:magnesium-dependent phosphatase-1 [Schizophyllum commune]